MDRRLLHAGGRIGPVEVSGLQARVARDLSAGEGLEAGLCERQMAERRVCGLLFDTLCQGGFRETYH